MSILSNKGMRFFISRAEQKDLKEILALQVLAYQSEAELLGTTDIPPLKQTIDDIAFEFSRSLFLKVTDENGGIVASVRGSKAEDTFYIGKLIVVPSLQGQNIGSKLLEDVERKCGCNRFELFTSTKSIKNIHFYEKAGYSIFKHEKITETLVLVYLQKIKNSVPAVCQQYPA